MAAAYVAAFEAGSNRPVVDVADAFHVSAKTISNKIFKARDRGLLTAPPPGRPGGELTDLAKQLLREAGLIQEDD
ncbi:MAG TPA: hypothetical protein VE623_25070 [Acidimicrobiales bacterium]|nr:hypothetical protein [Acidimicrobiales bacterium]